MLNDANVIEGPAQTGSGGIVEATSPLAMPNDDPKVTPGGSAHSLSRTTSDEMENEVVPNPPAMISSTSQDSIVSEGAMRELVDAPEFIPTPTDKSKSAKTESNEQPDDAPSSPLNSSKSQKTSAEKKKLNVGAVEFVPNPGNPIRSSHIPPPSIRYRPLATISETGAEELKSPKSGDASEDAEGGGAAHAAGPGDDEKGPPPSASSLKSKARPFAKLPMVGETFVGNKRSKFPMNKSRPFGSSSSNGNPFHSLKSLGSGGMGLAVSEEENGVPGVDAMSRLSLESDNRLSDARDPMTG